jgi:rod shape-determining protein MreC
VVNKRSNFKLGATIFFMVATAVVISVLKPGLLGSGISYVLYPILVVQSKVVEPLKQVRVNRCTLRELEKQVAALAQEKEELLAQNVELNASLDYVHEIKELHHFKDRYSCQSAHIVQILGRHFTDQEHFFWIDAGANKGIKQDMIAVHKNCLVGKVAQVYPWYSKVLLITDKSCKVAAHCVSSKAGGIYQGMHDEHSARLDHVNYLCNLHEHDLVVSTGEGLIYPRGFGVAKIASFKREGPFYAITLKPLVDMRALNYCSIITHEQGKPFAFNDSKDIKSIT